MIKAGTIVLIGLWIILHYASFAQPGNPDLSFGAGGIVSYNLGITHTEAKATAVQPDGRILVAGKIHDTFTGMSGLAGSLGDMTVARFLPGGDLDTTFGINGLVFLHFEPLRPGEATGIALQPDGKILLGGISNYKLALARLLPDGSPDPGFGTDGRVALSQKVADLQKPKVLLQPDGKILLAATAENPAFKEVISVLRFLPDGKPDPAFGQNGVAHSTLEGIFHGLNLQTDGKILLCGEIEMPSGPSDDAMIVLRFNADGSADSGFGSGGVATINPSQLRDAAWDVVERADSKIMLSGISFSTNSRYELTLARLLSDGKPDPSYGAGGLVTVSATNDFGFDFYGKRLISLPNSQWLVGGGFPNTSLLYRCHDNGAPVAGFGKYFEPGFAYVRPGDFEDLAISPDGSFWVVGAGYEFPGGISKKFCISHISPAGLPDSSFHNDGFRWLDVPGSNDVAGAASLLPDGKIVLGGNYSEGFGHWMAMRLHADGSPDAGFGKAGIATKADLSGSPNSLAIQPDEKILLAGNSWFNSNLAFTAVRFLPDGKSDPGFSGDGVFQTQPAGYTKSALADVAVRPDNKILLAGTATQGTNTEFVLMQLRPDGILDPFFANGGQLIWTVYPNDYGGELALLPDGKVLFAGFSKKTTAPGAYDLVIFRFLPDGKTDQSFGTAGRATLSNSKADTPTDILVLPDGRILLAGVSSNSRPYLARFLSNGAPDASFGDGGFALLNQYIGDANEARIARDAQGCILWASWYEKTGTPGEAMLLCRFLPDGQPDPSFGTGGLATFSPGDQKINRLLDVLTYPDGRALMVGAAQIHGSQFDVVALRRWLPPGIVPVLEPATSNDLPRVFPNPAPVGEAVLLSVFLNNNEKICLSLVSGSGQSKELFARRLPAGSHEIPLRFPPDTPRGWHVVAVQTETRHWAIPLILE